MSGAPSEGRAVSPIIPPPAFPLESVGVKRKVPGGPSELGVQGGCPVLRSPCCLLPPYGEPGGHLRVVQLISFSSPASSLAIRGEIRLSRELRWGENVVASRKAAAGG